MLTAWPMLRRLNLRFKLPLTYQLLSSQKETVHIKINPSKNIKMKTTDFTTSLKADVTMTAREYYEFRLLALSYNVPFLVRWEKDHCIVTTEIPFLLSKGYIHGIDF
jgi:hypothetical protein